MFDVSKNVLIATAAVAVIFSTPVYAKTYGSYVGGAVTLTDWGYQTDDTWTVNDLSAPGQDAQFIMDNNLEDHTEVSGEGHLGGFIRWDDDCWLTAIEIFGAPHTASDKGDFKVIGGGFDAFNFSQEVTSKWSYGADLKQGYFINEEWMLFGKLGVVRTKFDIETSFVALDTRVGGIKSEKSLTGVRLGLGLEKFFNDCLSLNFQTLYTRYQNHDQNYSTVFDSEPVYEELEIDIHSLQYALGFNYYFN